MLVDQNAVFTSKQITIIVRRFLRGESVMDCSFSDIHQNLGVFIPSHRVICMREPIQGTRREVRPRATCANNKYALQNRSFLFVYERFETYTQMVNPLVKNVHLVPANELSSCLISCAKFFNTIIGLLTYDGQKVVEDLQV